MKKTKKRPRIDPLEIHRLLSAHFGPLHWWPGETPFEVMVGAILTQNTAWTNVEKAIAALQAEGLLSPPALAAADPDLLRRCIRPSGYYNQKAERLALFVRWLLDEWRGNLDVLRRADTADLRQRLLALKGIGPETADSILLYALDHPAFVIDAYTRRIFSRLGLTAPDASYDELQEWFVSRLPADRALYNELHAQIVFLGKDFCRKEPRCEACPLRLICKETPAIKKGKKRQSP